MRIILLIALITCFTRITAQNLNHPFEACGVEGSITIYDLKMNKWITNNLQDTHRKTLPASTFKIANSLIALELGVVQDENELVPWVKSYDTTKYGVRPETYRAMNMKDAFKFSVPWVYVEFAEEIGKDRYKEYLDKINYGNGNLFVQGPDFWNFGEFGVSPSDQIELLIGIYEETLPFSKRSFEILKNIMINEQTDDYVIRAKTGWTSDGGKSIGWWVGYIEKADNTYFFATRILKDRNTPNANFGNCRKEISKRIFKELGIL